MPRTTRPRVLNSNGSPRVVRAPSPRRLQSLATDPAASLPPLDPFVAKAESPRLRAAPSRPGLPPGRVGSERSLPRGRHLKNSAAVGRVPLPTVTDYRELFSVIDARERAVAAVKAYLASMGFIRGSARALPPEVLRKGRAKLARLLATLRVHTTQVVELVGARARRRALLMARVGLLAQMFGRHQLRAAALRLRPAAPLVVPLRPRPRVWRARPLSSRRTFTTPHGEASNRQQWF